MKKYIWFFIFIHILTISQLSQSSGFTSSHLDLAEQFVDIMQFEKNTKVMQENMKATYERQLKKMEKPQLSDVLKAKKIDELLDNYAISIIDVVTETYEWNNVKDEYITAVAESYSEEKLKGIVNLFSQQAGKDYIEGQQAFIVNTMRIGEDISNKELIPKLQEFQSQLNKEVKKIIAEEFVQ